MSWLHPLPRTSKELKRAAPVFVPSLERLFLASESHDRKCTMPVIFGKPAIASPSFSVPNSFIPRNPSIGSMLALPRAEGETNDEPIQRRSHELRKRRQNKRRLRRVPGKPADPPRLAR